jgi:hypothetical protein
VGLLLAKAAVEESNKIIKKDDIMHNNNKMLVINNKDPDVNKVIPLLKVVKDISKTLESNQETLP